MKLLLNDKFIGLLIVINTFVTICLFYDNLSDYAVLKALDYFITILFCCEIALKVHSFKGSFFKSSWNVFDFIIVVTSSLSLLLPVIGINWVETGSLEKVLILRTFRLFKFFRVARIIPNVDKIYSDLKKAVRVTSGILIGGGVILVIVGVTLCVFFKKFDPINFGDPMVSIYTVFRLFSVEGWYEIPDAMCEKTSYLNATFIRISFSFIVLFGMFMLGFIISSISDELAIDNNDEIMQKTKVLEDKMDKLNEKIDLLMHSVS